MSKIRPISGEQTADNLRYLMTPDSRFMSLVLLNAPRRTEDIDGRLGARGALSRLGRRPHAPGASAIIR